MKIRFPSESVRNPSFYTDAERTRACLRAGTPGWSTSVGPGKHPSFSSHTHHHPVWFILPRFSVCQPHLNLLGDPTFSGNWFVFLFLPKHRNTWISRIALLPLIFERFEDKQSISRVVKRLEPAAWQIDSCTFFKDCSKSQPACFFSPKFCVLFHLEQ